MWRSGGALGMVDEIIAQAHVERDFLRTLPREEILRMLFVTLYSGATCLKHEGFKEEQEWRAVYHPQLGRSGRHEAIGRSGQRDSAACLEDSAGWRWRSPSCRSGA